MQISWIHNARFNSWWSISANRRCPTGLWNSSLIVGEPGVFVIRKVPRFKGKTLAGNVIYTSHATNSFIYEVDPLSLFSRRNSLSSSRDKVICNKLLFDREHSSDVKNVLSSGERLVGTLPPVFVPCSMERYASTDRSFFFGQLQMGSSTMPASLSYVCYLTLISWV